MICGGFSDLFFSVTGIFFLKPGKKAFDKEKIAGFLSEKGVALYDAASSVRRLQDNASDKFLEVVEPTDIGLLLRQLPQCRGIVTTGQKATDVVCETFHIEPPSVGERQSFEFADRKLYLYRMPSSSRAYPLKLEKKAEVYRKMLADFGLIEMDNF